MCDLQINYETHQKKKKKYEPNFGASWENNKNKMQQTYRLW